MDSSAQFVIRVTASYGQEELDRSSLENPGGVFIFHMTHFTVEGSVMKDIDMYVKPLKALLTFIDATVTACVWNLQLCLHTKTLCLILLQVPVLPPDQAGHIDWKVRTNFFSSLQNLV